MINFNRKLILYGVCSIIVACQSNEKKSNEVSNEVSMGRTKNVMSSESGTLENESTNEEKKYPVAHQNSNDKRETKKNEYAPLKEAMTRQNDEALFLEATQQLEKDSKDTIALNALSIYHYKKGQFDVSLSLLQEALKYNSNSADLYSNIGVLYLAKKEERLAIESFRKALEIDSDHLEASVNLGSIYLKGKDYDRAFVAHESAFDKGYRDFKFLLNYGVCAKAKGKFSLAEDIYKGLLKQQPNSREVLYNYAILLVEDQKNYDKGLDVVQKLKFIGEPQGTHNKIKALEQFVKNEKAK
ncbi:MAG TPA: tetratricopeptide repeat protein [Pseudobdellovibrionaceae bacterium]|nr:tetratricopeptide repeat protein [Pseudobdellovibrionaceae bacterium]